MRALPLLGAEKGGGSAVGTQRQHLTAWCKQRLLPANNVKSIRRGGFVALGRVRSRSTEVAQEELYLQDDQSKFVRMDTVVASTRRRGRPPKSRDEVLETRDLLLRAGLEVLTEKGFSSTGIDEILRRVSIPKGSFYHYFESKEAFGAELIDMYASYFARKLDRHLTNEALSPLARISAFVTDAQIGMERHGYRRGCLIGNFGQEMGALPESFRVKLESVFKDWQCRLARCLVAAKEAGELSSQADCQELASFFWIGWEGAVLRAKLERDAQPLRTFAKCFFAAISPG